MASKKILFQLSGSIACYKACTLISRLKQEGHDVRIACSRQALEFIGLATFEGLTGHPVFTDIQQEGRRMDHIRLAQWADLAILCPATANQINQLAQGIAMDVIGALFLAYDLAHKPYLIAPAMNHAMFRHPATQTALARLESWGVGILPVDSGALACGDEGPGRLLDPEKIFERILKEAGRCES